MNAMLYDYAISIFYTMGGHISRNKEPKTINAISEKAATQFLVGLNCHIFQMESNDIFFRRPSFSKHKIGRLHPSTGSKT